MIVARDRAGCAVVVCTVALVGCGGHHHPAAVAAARAAASHAARANQARGGASQLPRRPASADERRVLVTSERRNELVSVDARSGRLLARVRLPRDPENVIAGPGGVVIVSAAAHTVTVLDPVTLRVRGETRAFRAPHIPALSASGRLAYVTDDAAGTVTPVRLSDGHALAPVTVGAGAHHLAVSPDGRRLWVALGESARAIVILTLADPERPRVLRRFDPGFATHDLAFSPNGHDVWITAARGPDVTVLDAVTLAGRFRVAVGPPPQHVALTGASAYLTSGYGDRIERVSVDRGRVLGRVRIPYGSFELDAAPGAVVTSSLFTGTLTMLDAGLGHRRTLATGPAARDVALLKVPRRRASPAR